MTDKPNETFNALLADPLTPDEAEGKKALPPPGMYNLTVTGLTAFSGGEWRDTPRIRVEVSCPDTDADLDFYVNEPVRMGKRSRKWKLFNAIFPGQAMVGKSWNDLIGRSFRAVVTHDEMEGKPFAEYAFMPAS